MIAVLSLLLSGCTETVHGPRDEIRQFDWEAKMDNGNVAELSFCDSEAAFTVQNSDYVIDVMGLCSLTDDSIVIISDEDDVSYRFDYELHGDSVDLSYGGDKITLEKKVEE